MNNRTKREQSSIREFLYEEPGPRTRSAISVFTGASLVALLILFLWVFRLFAESGQLDGRYWEFFGRYTTWRFLGEGLLGTMQAAVVAGAVAFLLGFLMMLGRIGHRSGLRRLCTALIEFSRGVPTLLFIYFFFLVVPQFGIKLPSLWRIALPVAISASGTVAEILRSGIQAVPKGQWEAAYSLGMSYGRAFRIIIFPQAFRYVLPALISDLVIVVKDTTFAYVVNFPDLMQNAKVLISNYDALLSVYLVVGVIYILVNYILNKLSLLLANGRRSEVAVVEI